jgi:FMN phosphatase YigB (HAD superfamily)
MQYKSALLDLDDVLFPTYEYTEKVLAASVSAMIKQGLPADHDKAVKLLMSVRKERGSNAGDHFDCLCYVCGLDPAPQRIVQAGISAYHSLREKLWVPRVETDTFLAFLKDKEYRSSIITSGLENKQWFKIIRLEIQDYFLEKDEDTVKEFVYILPEDTSDRTKGKQDLSAKALIDMEADPEKSFVLDDRPYGIIAAKKAGVKYGIRLRRGKYISEECPKGTDKILEPDFEVESLFEAAKVISSVEEIFESKQAS